MKSDLNSVELHIVQHALGLDQGTHDYMYRNRYLVTEGGYQHRVLRGLEERGHMRFVRDVEDSNLLMYEVTGKTIALIEDSRE